MALPKKRRGGAIIVGLGGNVLGPKSRMGYIGNGAGHGT